MSCNLLLSYAFHAKTDLDRIRRDLVCGLLMVDSGAFTAWSLGKPIDRAAYAEYLENWAGRWDHAVSLDVIGDPVATAANTRWLHAKGIQVMPVFTPGGSLAEFDAMVKDCRYVCVGGLVGLPQKTQVARCRMLQRRAQDNGGGIHALGIGSMATLRAARPYSADASSVSGAFRFGVVIFFDGTNILNVPVTDRKKLMRYRTIIRDHGIDLADLARTGRMPGGSMRPALIQAMSLAYCCADESLKHSHPVPPPAGLPGTHLYSAATNPKDAWPVGALDRALHGTHLYNSVVTAPYGEAVAALDDQLHPATKPCPPPLWAIHGRSHTCTPRKVPA